MLRRLAPLLTLALIGCDGQERQNSAFSQSTHSSAIVPAGEGFDCSPIKVYDGDGPIWCAEGPRVRLSGIAAREMDGSCRSNQPCPVATAEAARDHLARLLSMKANESISPDASGHIAVRGPKLSCVSTGSAGGKRTGAWCASPRVGDLSCAMVASGLVLRWDRYWRGHRC